MSKMSHMVSKLLDKNKTNGHTPPFFSHTTGKGLEPLEILAQDIRNNMDMGKRCETEALEILQLERHANKTIFKDGDEEKFNLIIKKIKQELLETYDDLVDFECTTHSLIIDSKNQLLGKILDVVNTKNEIVHLLMVNKNKEVTDFHFGQSSENFTDKDWDRFLKEVENIHIGINQ